MGRISNRFSGQHELAIVVVVGSLLLLGAFIKTNVVSRWESQAIAKKQHDDAVKQVSDITNKIQVSDDTGRFIRSSPKVLDPWGIPIQFTFEEGTVTDNAEIRSSGPDKLFYTDDDIAEYRGRAVLAVATENASKEVKRQFKGIFFKD